jgi:uncharacterized protein Usg
MLYALMQKKIVLIDVYYYIPQTTLINEFIWQTEDIVPDIPRVHQFLNFWKSNIDAAIQEVMVSYQTNTGWRKVDSIFKV